VVVVVVVVVVFSEGSAGGLFTTVVLPPPQPQRTIKTGVEASSPITLRALIRTSFFNLKCLVTIEALEVCQSSSVSTFTSVSLPSGVSISVSVSPPGGGAGTVVGSAGFGSLTTVVLPPLQPRSTVPVASSPTMFTRTFDLPFARSPSHCARAKLGGCSHRASAEVTSATLASLCDIQRSRPNTRSPVLRAWRQLVTLWRFLPPYRGPVLLVREADLPGGPPATREHPSCNASKLGRPHDPRDGPGCRKYSLPVLRRWFRGARVWTGFLFAQSASAEAAVEPVRIEYKDAPGCPSEQAVTQQVLGRTRRARPARAGESARLFRISAASRAAGIVGRLEIVALDGTSTQRDVNGQTCAEVLEALTLVARIAIDPVHARDPDSREAQKPADSRAPPVRDAASGQKRADRPPKQESIQGASTADSAASASESRRSWSFRSGMGAQVFVSTTVSPSLTPGAGMFADLVGQPPAWLGLRAGLRLAASGESETGAGTARFTLIAARFGACMPRLQLSARWTICPIAGVETGVLNARGTETSGGRSATRPWLALGAGFRLEWRLTSQLFAELEGEGAMPVIRDRFVFDEPETTVHEPSFLGANGAIGLSYRLR
jgi:hypothetical protein